jgi:hypothetical protein
MIMLTSISQYVASVRRIAAVVGVAHHDTMVGRPHVLDAQPQRLLETQPGPLCVTRSRDPGYPMMERPIHETNHRDPKLASLLHEA